jgi:hypothetical protein
MFGHGRCPKCTEPVHHCGFYNITVGDQFAGPFFHGVAICYPNPQCQTVLSVTVDPASLVSDIANLVAKRIQGKTG